jgi:hypothetical protein
MSSNNPDIPPKKRWTPGLHAFVKKHSVRMDKWGRLVLYKRTMRCGTPWFIKDSYRPRRVYKVGAEVRCRRCNASRYRDCGPGLHVATREWARNRRCFGPRLIEVRVYPEDVVCVPYETRGKIRCKRLYVQRVVKA